jgi:hypothetical protein
MSLSCFPARAPAAIALSAALALAHGAGRAADRPDAADPRAAVPATRYESALRYAAAAPSTTTPDRAWRAANAIVGGAKPAPDDHAGHAGHEGADHEHHAVPMPAPRTCPSPGTAGGTGCGAAPGPGHDHGAPP